MRKEVVTVVIMHGNKVLLAKRSDMVGSFRGYWAFVSGYIEPYDKSPKERAILEIEEETGISDAEFVMEGEPFPVVNEKEGTEFFIHPFLFRTKTDKVKLDWEHTDHKWILPEELKNYKTPPKLDEDLKRVGLL